jgi:23S rRNA (uridine2552-2'-O)-methyltransferase
VGIDVAAVEPPLEPANVIALQGDLSDPSVAARLLEALGAPADAVLSDAAPKLTGIRATDRAREEALLEAVGALVPGVLKPGGTLLLKIMDGPEADAFVRAIRPRFEKAKTVRPEASRPGTTERYLVAWGFRGNENAIA